MSKKNINKDFIKIRSFLASNVDTLLENLSVRREASKIDSEDLFGDINSEESSSITWKTDYEKKTILDVLVAEKESLGLYVSGNPLEKYKKILNWVRETADSEKVFLVLVDKVKKIFTRSNSMMFALQISTPNEQEKLEGIIFPKYALDLSPILQEKDLFWVKGRIIENKKKKAQKEKVAEPEDSVQEYEELPKLAIENISKFENGVISLFENEEIKLPVNRIKKLESIDWVELKEKPDSIDKIEANPKAEKTEDTKTEEKEVKEIKIGKEHGQEKLKKIKSILFKTEEKGLEKVTIKIEKNGDWKTVKGVFWADINEIEKILSSA